MGLQAILDAIHACGEAQVRQIEAEAKVQAGEILAEAQAEARRLRIQARLAAAAPAEPERARILHQARFEALRIAGTAREEFVDAALWEARRYLAIFRNEPAYQETLFRLTREALVALDGSVRQAGQTRLEADPRDQRLLERVLRDLQLDLPIDYVLHSQGGLSAKSEDGRVIVINTFEARLERAEAQLRRHLTALFEDGRLDGGESGNERRKSECPAMTMATPAFGP